MSIVKIVLEEYRNWYPKKSLPLLRACLLYYRDPDFRVLVLIRIATSNLSDRLRKKVCKKLLIKYSVAISRHVKIGKNFKIGHYLGLVIGSGVVIGNNCMVYQHVTLGQVNETEYPKIGDNVTIYAGAKVLGGVSIGDNCKIGANAVVIKDVPKNCTAVGVPARIIQH